MTYRKHFREYRAPEINLPYGARLIRGIHTHFTIQDENEKSDLRKRACCKTCDKVSNIIVGSMQTVLLLLASSII